MRRGGGPGALLLFLSEVLPPKARLAWRAAGARVAVQRVAEPGGGLGSPGRAGRHSASLIPIARSPARSRARWCSRREGTSTCLSWPRPLFRPSPSPQTSAWSAAGCSGAGLEAEAARLPCQDAPSRGQGLQGEASAPGGREPPEATRVSASPEAGALAARSAGGDTGAAVHRGWVDPLRQTHSLPSAASRYRVTGGGFLVCSGAPRNRRFAQNVPGAAGSVPGPAGRLDPEQGARPGPVFLHR